MLCALVMSTMVLAQDVAIERGLVIGDIPRARRSPVHVDPVEAMLVAGSLDADATASWEAIEAEEDGWFRGPALSSAYILATVELGSAKTMILDAQGHSLVYVNGEPRAGDPYNYGFVRLPVALDAGANELLFRVTRGRMRATLREPRSPVMLDAGDATLPDIVAGEDGTCDAAVLVTNATGQWLRNLYIVAGGNESTIAPIGPYTVRKARFGFGGRSADMNIELRRGNDLLDEAVVTLRARQPEQRHVRTFVSDIDGSVQYYAVTPASDADATALILTLHGAGVEGRRQSEVYKPKKWAHVVAPTNRRKFGFDWEDWGRLDALEVLGLATARFGADPDRVYLTGHSMGGHGVWHLGATFPDRFAAIGPSAGWSSFFTYGGATRYAQDDPIQAILARAQQSSLTADLARNYLHHGVYVLHGDKDDNVPVQEARDMRALLDGIHKDVAYHEQPGAGHWWGDQCCDWEPMMEFFRTRVRTSSPQPDRIEFVTANPGISASSHWAMIESQVVPLALSGVEIELDRAARTVAITTVNVASLVLDPDGLERGATFEIAVDGQTLAGEFPMRPALYEDRWRLTDEPAPADHKGPDRSGPFKDAFRHRPMLVYGTGGSDEENAWAYRKARYDAETFWYRGNGVLDIVADDDFDPDVDADRSVILYGNARTNAAWVTVLAGSPVRVGREGIAIGDRRLGGDDLACLFIQPRRGSAVASVGVVSGTGVEGMRLTDRLPYFVSGVHYPDCIVLGPEMLADDAGGGLAGIRVAGIFGPDWSVERGDFAWRE